MFWKRLFAFFTPSPGAYPLLWAAPVATLLLTITAIVASLDDPALSDGTLIIISMCAIPIGMALLAIATFVEKKPGPRFLLWGAVNGLLLISLALFYASFPNNTEAEPPNPIVFICICLPVFAIPLLGQAFLGLKAYPAFRKALHSARSQRVMEIIQSRGEIQLSHLCSELSLGETQTLALVRELINLGELMAYVDKENQVVYSAAVLGEKQRRMAAIVATQGKASVEELAAVLKIRRDLVRQWVYSLVERRQLHGFVDWSIGTIYSQDVKPLLSQNKCPHCGGCLEIAGKGLIQCESCGVEVFQ